MEISDLLEFPTMNKLSEAHQWIVQNFPHWICNDIQHPNKISWQDGGQEELPQPSSTMDMSKHQRAYLHHYTLLWLLFSQTNKVRSLFNLQNEQNPAYHSCPISSILPYFCQVRFILQGEWLGVWNTLMDEGDEFVVLILMHVGIKNQFC